MLPHTSDVEIPSCQYRQCWLAVMSWNVLSAWAGIDGGGPGSRNFSSASWNISIASVRSGPNHSSRSLNRYIATQPRICFGGILSPAQNPLSIRWLNAAAVKIQAWNGDATWPAPAVRNHWWSDNRRPSIRFGKPCQNGHLTTWQMTNVPVWGLA